MTDQPTNRGPAYPTPGGGDPFLADTRTEEQRRPVPRFEVVHKPKLMATDASGRDRRPVPNPQPWHVRIIGGNGEPLFTSETYVHEASAYEVIVAVGRMFRYDDARIEDFDTDRPFLMCESHDGLDTTVPVLRVEVGP